MRILLLSRWFPYPPNNGSKIRIWNVLRQLARRHQVSLLTLHEPTDALDAESLRALQTHCCAVQAIPRRPFHPGAPRALLGLLAPQPRFLFETRSEQVNAAVARAVRQWRPELVVASEFDMIPYALDAPGVPLVLEDLELSVYLDAIATAESRPGRLRAWLTWLKLARYLRRNLPRFAACTVVSERERRNLRRAAPGYSAVRIVPNAVDLSDYAADFGPPRPDRLVFCGSLSYGPNFDAVRTFLAEVYPAIRRQRPEVELLVTGAHDGVDLAALPVGPGVRFSGQLPDVRPAVAQSWASVVPLRQGGGTRLKIVESLALGTPVVSTSKGAEGLEVTDGQNILLADDPARFAQRVVELLDSPAQRASLAAAGRRLVAERYDWELVGRELCALVERVVEARAA